MKNDFWWFLKMALRDSRKQRGRLLLFISSIVLGISAIVAINTFVDNVKNDIQSEAKGLLGADMVLRDNQKLKPEVRKILDSFGVETSGSMHFNSMVRVLKNEGTRLVNVVSTDGKYPFYGKIETEPSGVYSQLTDGHNALVDNTLFIQFNLSVGDSIQIGAQRFAVLAAVTNAPGQTGFTSAIAPNIYIANGAVEQTGLIRYGSRLNDYLYVKETNTETLTKIKDLIEAKYRNASLRVQTFENRSQQTGEAFGDAGRFLNLVAFIALLLGGIGIASTINIYLKSKIKDVAILACIGIPSSKAFRIYLLQIILFGFAGAVAGSLLGSALAYYLPVVMSDFLPVEVHYAISPAAIIFGLLTGIVTSLLFTIDTLMKLAQTPPLAALRSYIDDIPLKRIQLWFSRLLILFFIILFAWYLLESWFNAVVFTAGCGLAVLLLTGLSQLMKNVARRLVRPGWSFTLRQAIANLYRPNNQSTVLISTIGLGTALITLLFLTQDMLLSKVSFKSSDKDPNMILFDIQTPQLDEVSQFVKSQEMPVMATVPIVTMRLELLRDKNKAYYFPEENGESANENGVRDHVFNREWRVSYRDSLNDNEEIIAGEWIGKYAGKGDIPISVEERNLEYMQAKVGDKLTFNVQGAPLNCYIASVRKVDFRRIETNFTLLFPTGILENAPQTQVVITRANSAEQSAHFQQQFIARFPAVSVVDLNFIIKTVSEIIDKLKFVITFMSLFSMATGFIILIGALFNSRYQRIKETVLLKTIGASAKKLLRINLFEYALLGAFAAIAGILLASVAAYALSIYTFSTVFVPAFSSLLLPIAAITTLVVVIGYFNTNTILKQTPLEVLRKENA
ncbi:FtsX-like permease family protein [bacterium]|nr:FtsX-like permease family protein [bacterium]